MAIQLENQTIETTSEGFLVNREDWTPEVGSLLAESHGVEISDAHTEIIELLQAYCNSGNKPPSMRELTAEIKTKLSPEKARGIYLMKLFGPSPAKMAARLAGLPRPKNCL